MRDTQDQQVPTSRLQQGLQPCFKAAPGDDQYGQGIAGGHFLTWEASPLNSWATDPPTHQPQASPGAAGILLLAFLLSPLPGLQVL